LIRITEPLWGNLDIGMYMLLFALDDPFYDGTLGV